MYIIRLLSLQHHTSHHYCTGSPPLSDKGSTGHAGYVSHSLQCTHGKQQEHDLNGLQAPEWWQQQTWLGRTLPPCSQWAEMVQSSTGCMILLPPVHAPLLKVMHKCLGSTGNAKPQTLIPSSPRQLQQEARKQQLETRGLWPLMKKTLAAAVVAAVTPLKRGHQWKQGIALQQVHGLMSQKMVHTYRPARPAEEMRIQQQQTLSFAGDQSKALLHQQGCHSFCNASTSCLCTLLTSSNYLHNFALPCPALPCQDLPCLKKHCGSTRSLVSPS